MKKKHFICAIAVIIAIFFVPFNVAACQGGGTTLRQEELGRLLLKTNYSNISYEYLCQPYGSFGNDAHAGIDYPAGAGKPVYAPVTGTYYQSSTEYTSNGSASYVILSNEKRLFLHHMKNRQFGYFTKGQKIGEINSDHVHAELRVNYYGSYLVAGNEGSCGGTTCSYSQLQNITGDPSEVVTQSSSTLTVYDFWRSSDPICADPNANQQNQNFDSQYKIQNTGGASVTIDQLALAIHHPDNTPWFDLKIRNTGTSQYYYNVTLNPGDTFHFDRAFAYFTDPGNYKIVAKAYVNGQWNELMALDFEVKNCASTGATYYKAQHRLPPVIYSLDIPHSVQPNTNYSFKWTVMGYHDSYNVTICVYDEQNTKIATDTVTPYKNSSGQYVWDDIQSKEFFYETTLNLAFSGSQDLTVRFFASPVNDAFDATYLSCLIPGGLGYEAGDSTGRKIKIAGLD